MDKCPTIFERVYIYGYSTTQIFAVSFLLFLHIRYIIDNIYRNVKNTSVKIGFDFCQCLQCNEHYILLINY